ncbi:MAG TPA: hypothetical protein VK760_13005, partial [Candidatus Acidoferrales bacterium]|nr:hypothetical protein [Candidatus Acidoferrales bacterium]
IALVAIGAAWAAVGAQTALVAAADGRNAPGGDLVIAIRPGTKVVLVSTKESHVLVTVDGWVDASRLTAKLDTFPASVDAKAPLRVRASASANAPIVAELRPRTGVHTLGKSGTWMRIKRSAWIPASVLPKTAPVAATKPIVAAKTAKPSDQTAKPSETKPPAKQLVSPPAPAATESVPQAAVPPGAMSVAKSTKVLVAPGGASVGELAAGAVVQELEHDHGFAKVRIEGWVPERELSPADATLGAQLTAADLRADPEGTRGKSVQWEVEVLAFQTADPLRRELARDEPYLLAKGPGTENSLLYLAIPPSLLAQAKALQPLTRVLITARVRAGHSEPVGTPILDLKSISKR